IDVDGGDPAAVLCAQERQHPGAGAKIEHRTCRHSRRKACQRKGWFAERAHEVWVTWPVTVPGDQQVAVRQQEIIGDYPWSVQTHEARALDPLQPGRPQGTLGDRERDSLSQGKERDECSKTLVKIPGSVRLGSGQETV